MIGALNYTNSIYSLSAINSAYIGNSADLPSSGSFDDSYIEDEYNSSPAYEIAQSFITSKSISSFADYKNYRMQQLMRAQNPSYDPSTSIQRNDYSEFADTTNVDLEAEYKDFLTIKGCKNDEELKVLNSSIYPDAETMRSFVHADLVYNLHELGLDIPGFNTLEFVNKSSLKDVANFADTFANAQTAKDKLKSMEQFLSSGLTNSNLSEMIKNLIQKMVTKLQDAITAVNSNESLTGKTMEYDTEELNKLLANVMSNSVSY